MKRFTFHTNIWKVKDRVVLREELPTEIQKHVELYDRMKEDLADIQYKQQIYSMALAVKKSQIDNMVKKQLESSHERDEDK